MFGACNFGFVIFFNMYIKIRVITGAKKESFKKISDDHVEISVKEEAKQNQANRRILELVRENFGLKSGRVRIISGHHSPSKIVSIDD